MSKLFITYQLKPNITTESFEAWVQGRDYPTLRGLTRVSSFVTNRAVRHLLSSDTSPSVSYIEEFVIPDLEGFMREDFGTETVQKILGEFMAMVDHPEFIVAEEIG
jgi:hypothetical protein